MERETTGNKVGLTAKIVNVYANNLRVPGYPNKILDVSNLQGNGLGARVEIDKPRGDRVCFTFHDVIICSLTSDKLDLAERLIGENKEIIEGRLDRTFDLWKSHRTSEKRM